MDNTTSYEQDNTSRYTIQQQWIMLLRATLSNGNAYEWDNAAISQDDYFSDMSWQSPIF